MVEPNSYPALDWQSAAERRPPGALGNPLIYLPEIDSTNTYAAGLLPGAAAGTVVVADYQTSGRGRLRRPWVAEFGSSLTLTIILSPIEPAWIAPMAVGLALVDTLAAFGIAAALKWPNDVLVDCRKCCGILIESTLVDNRPWLLAGIGVNVHGADPSLPFATYLDAHAPEPLAREGLLVTLLDHAQRWLDRGAVQPARVRDVWRSRLSTIGQQITAQTPSGAVSGLAMDVADDGGLIIRLEDGSRQIVRAGDVTLAAPPKDSYMATEKQPSGPSGS